MSCSKSQPQEQGKGYEFVDKIVGGVIPREYIPAVDKGIREAMQSGGVAGYPVVDIKVSLVDGSFHPVDSSEMAFTIAGSMAFKEAIRKGAPQVAGADHEGRSHHARGIHGRCDRRPEQPPRPYQRHGDARRTRRSSARDRAAGEYVRLCRPRCVR